MSLNLGPGVHRIPEADYHRDPCITPSASSSILKVMDTESPRHAWTRHPRLNPDYEGENKAAFDLGTAAHALILGDDVGIEVIDADSFRTKDAKEARDNAYAAGRVPILVEKMAEVRALAEAFKAQLASSELGNFLENTEPQVTLVWEEAPGLLCRALLDWHPDNPHEAVFFGDLKSTTAGANPHGDGLWRRLNGTGADIQAAHYMRGLTALYGPNPRRRWIIPTIETTPPYALSLCEFSSSAMAQADYRLDHALARWKRCLDTGKWPGYPANVITVEPPPWIESQLMEREERALAARQPGGEHLQKMMEWQAPQEASRT